MSAPAYSLRPAPTALADADARWAHSAYLQVGAETGVIGAALLGLVLLWVFGALYRSRQDERLIVIGTAAVTALAVHAAIDYVAHFPHWSSSLPCSPASLAPARGANHPDWRGPELPGA